LANFGTYGLAANLLSSTSINLANAAPSSDYRALVCLFFRGGLDHNDTIIPFDPTSYGLLADARQGLFSAYAGSDPTSSSRARTNLLKLNPENSSMLSGREYALPRELQPLHDMFENSEDLAIVGRVGSLAQDGTTRQTVQNRTVNLPPRLFSHNDQQNYWQGLGIEGATIGWGGQFIDNINDTMPGNDPRYAAMITSSSSLLLNGEQTIPFRVGINGPADLDFLRIRDILGRDRSNDDTRELLDEYLSRRVNDTTNLFKRDHNLLQARALSDAVDARSAYAAGTRVTNPFPNSNLGGQLEAVANAIRVQNNLGVSRQIFFVAAGGFDTHNNQAEAIPTLHSGIANSIAAFKQAMLDCGQWNNVTLFTAADFGRTFVENGSGTDHGWGSHHFVAGGSVRGKKIYGELPSADVNGPEYTDARGRLIPSTSIEQYVASLGSWLGVDNGALTNALPNLPRFSAGPLNLFT